MNQQELVVLQDISLANIDRLIDEMMCKYRARPHTILLSSQDYHTFHHHCMRYVPYTTDPSTSLFRYRGIEVQMQETFALGTLVLIVSLE